MKTIALVPPAKKAELYEIFLGNGTHYVFRTDREAKAFTAKTNKFLTQQLFELNTIYTDVFHLYRQYWLLMDNTRDTRKASTYQDDRDCQEHINSVSTVLNQTLFFDDHKNGSYLVFINLKKASGYLQKIITTLRHYADKRGSTVDLYTFQSLLKRLMQLDTDLDGYGKMECYGLFDLSSKRINEHINLKQVI